MFEQFRGLLKEINGKKQVFCFEEDRRNSSTTGYDCKILSSCSMERKIVAEKGKLNFIQIKVVRNIFAVSSQFIQISYFVTI